jgi:hypothetical protein
MDIKSLETKDLHDAGAEIQVKDQEGKLTDFYITVVGIDSTVWRGIQKRIQRASIDAMVEGKPQPVEDQAKTLAQATIDWRGLKDGRSKVEFSAEIAERLYTNAPYIADQVDRFIGNRTNFIKG